MSRYSAVMSYLLCIYHVKQASAEQCVQVVPHLAHSPCNWRLPVHASPIVFIFKLYIQLALSNQSVDGVVSWLQYKACNVRLSCLTFTLLEHVIHGIYILQLHRWQVDSHYVSISDYVDRRNKDSLELSEGQIVEVLDSSQENRYLTSSYYLTIPFPSRWFWQTFILQTRSFLCRWKVRTTGTRNTPEEGWVSCHYLERKASLTPVESRLGRVISSQDSEEKYRDARMNRK